MERPDKMQELNPGDFCVGIVGKGKMGTSLFNCLLDFEFPLVWVCKEKEDVEELEKQVRKRWRRTFRAGVVNRDWYANRLDQIQVSHSPDKLVACNLIIETITEDLFLKRQLFETLDRVTNSDCIFASCSSSIPPEEWYLDGRRKDKAVGMHFFYPVPFTNIAELIITRDTSRITLHYSQFFLQHIHKKFLLQQGESAFLLNRVFLDFQAGAYRLCEEKNLSFPEMDDLIVKEFFPVGVFEIFDRVGIDVILNSIDRYTKNEKNRDFYQPLLNYLEKMVRENRLGMKTAHGFYRWEAQQRITPDNGHPENTIDANTGPITERLKGWYMDAAARFVEQGYCSKKELTFAVKEYMNCEKGPFEL